MFRTIQYIAVTVLAFVHSTNAISGSCEATECSNNSLPNGQMPAYWICRQALVENTFNPMVQAANYTFPFLIAACEGFCTDSSRRDFDGLPGATWDICAGCEDEYTATICNFCDASVGVEQNQVGFCSLENHQTAECNFDSGDGTASHEERIGRVTPGAENAHECFDLIRNHRPTANGATFQIENGDCYAEYSMSGMVPDDRYKTCAFVFHPTAAPTRLPSSVATTVTIPAATAIAVLPTEDIAFRETERPDVGPDQRQPVAHSAKGAKSAKSGKSGKGGPTIPGEEEQQQNKLDQLINLPTNAGEPGKLGKHHLFTDGGQPKGKHSKSKHSKSKSKGGKKNGKFSVENEKIMASGNSVSTMVVIAAVVVGFVVVAVSKQLSQVQPKLKATDETEVQESTPLMDRVNMASYTSKPIGMAAPLKDAPSRLA